jgi:hypothetical protein
MERGQKRADKVRETNRKGLLEQLKNKGLIQQVIESNNKLADLTVELTQLEVTRIKSANDTRMALVKKYLPDVKQTELVGEEGADIKTVTRVERVIVNATNTDS